MNKLSRESIGVAQSLGSGTISNCIVDTKVDIPILGGRYVGSFMSFGGLVDAGEHLAIGLGDWESAEEPLVRLHSECLTGDVFESQKCDCGAQLVEAIERIDEVGGLVLYLRQEGRGIGLYNKLKAYRLQNAGLNTYQANNELGFPHDMRSYESAAQMLRALNKVHIQLLSNNPDKLNQLVSYGIKVAKRVSTRVYCNKHNRDYLETKVNVSGHHISAEDL